MLKLEGALNNSKKINILEIKKDNIQLNLRIFKPLRKHRLCNSKHFQLHNVENYKHQCNYKAVYLMFKKNTVFIKLQFFLLLEMYSSTIFRCKVQVEMSLFWIQDTDCY